MTTGVHTTTRYHPTTQQGVITKPGARTPPNPTRVREWDSQRGAIGRRPLFPVGSVKTHRLPAELRTDLLADIFVRNRGLYGYPPEALFSHFQTKSAPSKTRGSKDTRLGGLATHTVLFSRFQFQKSVSLQLVSGFSCFPVQKSIPRREKRQKCCILYLLNCGKTIPGGVSK